MSNNTNDFIGPIGPQGPAGIQGPTGPIGTTGIIGQVGPIGNKGSTGLKGLIGEKGATGPTGYGVTGATGKLGAIGSIGPKGETGATGPTGVTGPGGVLGPKGPKGDSFGTFRSNWSSTTNYLTSDVVIYANGFYIAIEDNINKIPTNLESWIVFEIPSTVGPTGAIGVGLTGLKGSNGPIGATGERGATGPAGKQGALGKKGLKNTATKVLKGSWLATTGYVPGNIVYYYLGGFFEAVTASKNVIPGTSPTHWKSYVFTGLTGDEGPEGPTGPVGPKGIIGDLGDSTGYYIGFWDSQTNYDIGDIVSTNNETFYIANLPNTNVNPATNPTEWLLYTLPGAIGPTGIQGIEGLQGEEGAEGIPGPTGPIGMIGEIGITGPRGPNGTGAGVFKGKWLPTGTYAAGQIVIYNGLYYMSIAPKKGAVPNVATSAAFWKLYNIPSNNILEIFDLTSSDKILGKMYFDISDTNPEGAIVIWDGSAWKYFI